jgi:hypothetical protein
MDAIHFKPEVTEAVSLKEFKKENRGLSPEEKRLQFTIACSHDLRDHWVSERSG